MTGGLRQFVGLVDDHSAGIRQDGASSRTPMDGVCQEQIVVADLEGKTAVVTVLPKGKVACSRRRRVSSIKNFLFILLLRQINNLNHFNL